MISNKELCHEFLPAGVNVSRLEEVFPTKNNNTERSRVSITPSAISVATVTAAFCLTSCNPETKDKIDMYVTAAPYVAGFGVFVGLMRLASKNLYGTIDPEKNKERRQLQIKQINHCTEHQNPKFTLSDDEMAKLITKQFGREAGAAWIMSHKDKE